VDKSGLRISFNSLSVDVKNLATPATAGLRAGFADLSVGFFWASVQEGRADEETGMNLLLSIAIVAAGVFGSEWLVDNWLGEDRRFWVGLAGIALLLLAGALVQASGINELTRVLRNLLIGAGIGAALNRLGLRLGWLRGGLRLFGIKTEPQERPPEFPRWSRSTEVLLTLGWGGSLIGLGVVWTGIFGG
jgi:hypothetical protein